MNLQFFFSFQVIQSQQSINILHLMMIISKRNADIPLIFSTLGKRGDCVCTLHGWKWWVYLAFMESDEMEEIFSSQQEVFSKCSVFISFPLVWWPFTLTVTVPIDCIFFRPLRSWVSKTESQPQDNSLWPWFQHRPWTKSWCAVFL